MAWSLSICRSGENFQNHWVRSGCKVGNLPCNGMLYVAPHPCGCYIDAKLTGFNALAASTQVRLGTYCAATGARGRVQHFGQRFSG